MSCGEMDLLAVRRAWAAVGSWEGEVGKEVVRRKGGRGWVEVEVEWDVEGRTVFWRRERSARTWAIWRNSDIFVGSQEWEGL